MIHNQSNVVKTADDEWVIEVVVADLEVEFLSLSALSLCHSLLHLVKQQTVSGETFVRQSIVN